MTDWMALQPPSAPTVAAADYTGDWFGFVTRARARNYRRVPGAPAEGVSSLGHGLQELLCHG